MRTRHIMHMYTCTHVTSCTCTHIHTSHHAHVHHLRLSARCIRRPLPELGQRRYPAHGTMRAAAACCCCCVLQVCREQAAGSLIHSLTRTQPPTHTQPRTHTHTPAHIPPSPPQVLNILLLFASFRSIVTRHASHVTRHTTHVTPHTSPSSPCPPFSRLRFSEPLLDRPYRFPLIGTRASVRVTCHVACVNSNL